MRNILRIFKRDALRLLKVPAAIIVVLTLSILPSLYTWYNVLGFWNPYENTGKLQVVVVNEDQGGDNELVGHLNVGDSIVEALHDNHQLGWRFEGYDDGMELVRSGTAFAAFVIPEDFTHDLLTLTTGDFEKPDIQYYVNEKYGPVAPKIADTGATTLDETINSEFVTTVSEAAVKAFDKASDEVDEKTAEAKSQALMNLDGALEEVAGSREMMADLSGQAEAAVSKVASIQESLSGADSDIDRAAGSLSDMAQLSSDLSSELSELSAKAMPSVNQSIALISQTSAKAAQTAADMAQAASRAQGDIASALGDAQAIVTGNDSAISSLQQAVDAMPDGTTGKTQLAAAVQDLRNANDRARSAISSLEQANSTVKDVSDKALADMDSINAAVQEATRSATDYSNTLFSDVIPSLERSLSSLGTATARASSTVLSQRLMVRQARDLTGDMQSALSTFAEALSQTDGLLGDVEAGLDTVRTDITAIGRANVLVELLGDDAPESLNAEKIGAFIGAPTSLVTEQLYATGTYGSDMAPLFMNLTFWIGAFMIIIIMREEVDAKGIESLTLTQRYLGRFLLFAAIVVMQAVVCCTGLPIIGMHVVDLVALYIAAVITALSYLSIIYCLAVSLQHVGKGLCVVLVFLQIPAATGLYPIEMTAPFFQSIYPMFPFTYGINAMREAICGFYEFHYLHDVLVLVGFFAVFMALGLLGRPLLSNVNRMFAREIKVSGIFNGEDAEIPARRFRFSQLVSVLSNREDFRKKVEARYDRFVRLYPELIKWCIIVGIAAPVLFTIIFSLNVDEKVVLLAVWLSWIVLVFLFLIIVESLKASIERQMRLDGMSESELRGLYRSRNSMEPVSEAPPVSLKKATADGGRFATEASAEADDSEDDGTADTASDDDQDEGGEHLG